MPDPDFGKLRGRLLEAGIGGRHARRVVRELEDHFEDIVDARINDGVSPEAASSMALEALGDMDDFVIAMQARPELRSWAFRFPRLALIAYPLMCLAMLPVYPVSAGVTHAPNIARWGFCFMCAGLVTVSILLGLRLAILFG
jgi:hypothetical protein